MNAKGDQAQRSVPELLEEIDRLRRERDEALTRVEATRGELRDLRVAVDQLTGMLTEFLDATRPAGPTGTVNPIRPLRDDE